MSLADLFRPKWKHSEWRVRQQAVRSISDEKRLEEIACRDSNPEVRKEAAQRVHDQRLLGQIATRDSDQRVRKAATRNLHDVSVIREVVRERSELTTHLRLGSNQRDACLAALGELPAASAQSILADCALSAESDTMALVAVSMLKDQTLLVNIAADSRRDEVGLEALKKLADQKLLADVARKRGKGLGYKVRDAALSKLDRATVVELAKADEPIAEAAAGVVHDQAMLADLARNAGRPRVRFQAAKRLADTALAEVTLAELAGSSGDRNIDEAAMDSLTDQRALAMVAKKPGHALQEQALSRLISENALLDVAKGGADARIRLAAAKKITDSSILAELLEQTCDADVRLMAEKRLTSPSVSEPQRVLRKCRNGTYGTGQYSRVRYLKGAELVAISFGSMEEESADGFIHTEQGQRHFVRWSDVFDIDYGGTMYSKPVPRGLRDHCDHTYSPWEETGCCVDYPYCNCERKNRKKRICVRCETVEWDE